MGGVVADRFHKKKVLIAGDLIAGILTFGIVLLNYNHLNIYYLFLFTFLLSTISAIYLPTFQSVLPSVVNKENIMNANSFFSIHYIFFINLTGPVIAGMIIGFWGPFINICINSFTFLLSAICVIGMQLKINNVEKKSHENIVQSIKSSFAYIRGTSWLLRGLILNICVYLGAGSIGSLIQFYLRNILQLSGKMIGVSFALFEFLPMFLMGYLTPYICKKFNYEKVMMIGSFHIQFL
ncbi:hypothetical protein C1N87_02775 [Priestia aryabhattai]